MKKNGFSCPFTVHQYISYIYLAFSIASVYFLIFPYVPSPFDFPYLVAVSLVLVCVLVFGFFSAWINPVDHLCPKETE